MRWGLAVALFGLLGCAPRPHVRLEAPDRRAPGPERIAAYERLRAQAEPRYRGETFDDLRLADGRHVWHPEDILPVVPSRSIAARAATRAESLRETSTLLLVGGGGLVIAGSVWLGAGVSGNADSFLDSTGFGLAVATVGLGVAVAALSAIPEWAANDATSTAFQAYDRALRRRLGLCVAGFQVVPCR